MRKFGKNVCLFRWCLAAPFLFAMLFCHSTAVFAQGSNGGITTKISSRPYLTGNTLSGDGGITSMPLQGGGVMAQQCPAPVATPDPNHNPVVQSIITLSLVEETQYIIPQGFTANVTITIQTGADEASAKNAAAITQTLTVTYDSTAGGKYKAKSYITFSAPSTLNASQITSTEGYCVLVTVQSVNATPGQLAAGIDARNILKLENEMDVTYFYQLPNNVTPSVLEVSSIQPQVLSGQQPDALSVDWAWPANTGNNYTELEWTWLETEMAGAYTINGSLSTNLLFRHNSTRVDLFSGINSYNIPLLYDGAGNIYFRIRAVNVLPGGAINAGPWSTPASQPFAGHNNYLNWQVTTSFAEEGKRKSVIQYYDGSLRGRQTVTKDNSTNTTITAETFYDLQGRPAIQILPAPGMNNIIAYTQNLNLFNNQTAGTDPAQIFDLVPINQLGSQTLPDPMDANPGLSPQNGTAQYYSQLNPEQNTGGNSNIPDAGGYPYTVTRYEPDATGRVMMQSGVGPAMQMGSGHETKYYYGTPLQEELDGLFGTEVGDHAHYFKNMVIDANGQASVSYVDMHGRTIATALSGGSPANLAGINNNTDYPNQGGTSITSNLLANGGNVVKNNTIESINTVLVSTANTPYTFTYSLAAQGLQLPACSGVALQPYNYFYDLEIQMVNEATGQPVPLMKPDGTTATDITYSNISSETPVLTLTTVNPPAIGSYSIRKTLTLRMDALQTALQAYLTPGNGICKTLAQTITDDSLAAVAASGCAVSGYIGNNFCLELSQQSQTQYQNAYYSQLGITNPTPAQQQAAAAAYSAALTHCATLSTTVSHRLDDIKSAMLTDMAPYSGQYATAPAGSSQGTMGIISPVTGNTIAYGSMYNKYNIFSTNEYLFPSSLVTGQNVYLDASGNPDPTIGPAILPGITPDAFAGIFQDSWAASLLPYHPEYNKLAFAQQNLQPSYNWIEAGAFAQAVTYAAASTAGFLSDITSSDPYFTTANTNDRSIMQGYINGGWQGQNISMWQVAYGNVACANIADPTSKGNCYSGAPAYPSLTPSGTATPSLAPGQENTVWTNFQGFYQSARDAMINAFIDSKSPLGDAETLIAQGYILHFPKSADQAVEQTGGSTASPIPGSTQWYTPSNNGTTSAPSVSPTATADQNNSIVAGYTATWETELLQNTDIANLPAAQQTALINKIIGTTGTNGSLGTGFSGVCQNATDVAHPSGATNAPLPNADGFTSFEQVFTNALQWYNSTYQPAVPLTESITCNPYVIQYPKPYGSSPVITQQQISGVDNCTCSEYAQLLNNAGPQVYTNGAVDLSKLNAYIKGIYGMDTITQDLFNGLGQCSELGTGTSTVTVTQTFYATTSVNLYENYSDGLSYTSDLNSSRILTNDNPYSYGGYPIYTFGFFRFDDFSTIPANANIVSAKMSLYADPDGYNHPAFPNAHSVFAPPASPSQLFIITPGTQWSSSDISSLVNTAGNGVCVSESGVSCSLPITDPFQNVISLDVTSTVPSWMTTNTGICLSVDNEGGNFSYTTFCSNTYPDVSKRPTLVVQYTVPSSGGLSVYTLPSPQPLPQYLACGFAGAQHCLTCNAITTYNSNFVALFPIPGNYTAVPLAPAGSGTLSTQDVGYNTLYQNYLNYQTGFQYTWLDYQKAATNAGCSTAICAPGSAQSDIDLYLNAYTQPAAGYVATDAITLHSGFSFTSSNSTALSATINTTLATCGSGTGQQTAVLCPNTATVPLTSSTDVVQPVQPCQQASDFAAAAATQAYQNQVAQLTAAFTTAYLNGALNTQESFTINYTTSEYHYTLYYYDMAGNLVKTVPPKGVHPDFTNSAAVEAAKLAGTASPMPHTFITSYCYNSLNQVMAENTPDAGSSRFWYDILGRLCVSQNAKQAVETNPAAGGITGAYSYTLYDALGRITEVGQKPQGTAMTQTIIQDNNALAAWLNDVNNTGTYKQQITRTTYDFAYVPLAADNGAATLATLTTQRNLRNRVSYSEVFNTEPDGNADATAYHASATYYTYDIHGNVDTLLQDYGNNAGTPNVMNRSAAGNRFKAIVYDYDLISGKVNQVSYQAGYTDAVYHQYYYDAENRITSVQTSRDNIYYEQDAAYSYYKHGPLMQATLGKLQVQQLNYAYTVQGWLKNVNAGWEGNAAPGGGNTPPPPGVYGFSLHYYPGDYAGIGSSTGSATAIFNGLGAAAKPLYNGNIAAMAVSINVPGTAASGSNINNPMVYNYGYDQLNRIVSMNTYTSTNNTFASLTAVQDYTETVKYDPNGNITSYTRNGYSTPAGTGLQIDNLAYNYTPSTNRLSSISDAAGAPHPNMGDIGNQNAGNYAYDAIGNLTGNVAENIGTTNGDGTAKGDGITWTVYGKIQSIAKTDGTVVNYTYDIAGNRISKAVTKAGATATTWYVRDASGNVMGIYTAGGTNAVNNGDLTQSETPLYGSNRLGENKPNTDVQNNIAPVVVATLPDGVTNIYATVFTRGQKFFELSNHLGNVMVTVTDKLLEVNAANNGIISSYTADVATAQDYYPFGMVQPGRQYGNMGRYGFNGKENDNDIETGAQDYGMRIYDGRIAKFLSVDLITAKYPELTPYQFASNIPIAATDLDGLEASNTKDKDDGNIFDDFANWIKHKTNNYGHFDNNRSIPEQLNENKQMEVVDKIKIASKGVKYLAIGQAGAATVFLAAPAAITAFPELGSVSYLTEKTISAAIDASTQKLIDGKVDWFDVATNYLPVKTKVAKAILTVLQASVDYNTDEGLKIAFINKNWDDAAISAATSGLTDLAFGKFDKALEETLKSKGFRPNKIASFMGKVLKVQMDFVKSSLKEGIGRIREEYKKKHEKSEGESK